MKNGDRKPAGVAQEGRVLELVKKIFRELLEIADGRDDLGWAVEFMNFLNGLQERHGPDTVKLCLAYYASTMTPWFGGMDPKTKRSAFFDFEGQDSIVRFMVYLGRRHLGYGAIDGLMDKYRVTFDENAWWREPNTERTDDFGT